MIIVTFGDTRPPLFTIPYEYGDPLSRSLASERDLLGLGFRV